jgi:putative DNA primase/helicase
MLRRKSFDPTSVNSTETFAEALRRMGLVVEGAPIMDGHIHRVPVEGDKRGQKSGAYVGHLDGIPAGYVKNHRSGETRNWKGVRQYLNREDWTQLRSTVLAQRAAREREVQATHAATAGLIGRHLEGLPLAPDDHPYLVRKRVPNFGVFLDIVGTLEIRAGQEEPQKWSAKGNLIIPIRAIDGSLLSAQTIAEDGWKVFPRGARCQGGMHQIGDFDGRSPLVVVEGYATGATIHQLTALPVAVAFFAGNLEAAAKALRGAFPEARLLIAGDNDHQKARERQVDGTPKPNVGKEAAHKAADAVSGYTILPTFAPDDQGSDWNDLVVTKGEETFAAQWASQMAIVERHCEVERIAAERNDTQADEKVPMLGRRGG